ncbi:MAG: zinc-ribbon domain-containing protein [Dehalococcoidia bacterium]|nr:zinc-ribbon domain-containing protein [Dehalococcoidia bacterium]
MKMMKKALLACLLALWLAVSATPVFADGDGGRIIFGDSFTLESGEKMDGDLVVLGGSVVLETRSRVDGNVVVMGGSARVAGEVEGDLVTFGGDVVLRSTAVVDGDLVTIGGSVQREPGAIVRGTEVEGSVFEGFSRFWALSPAGPILGVCGAAVLLIAVVSGVVLFARRGRGITASTQKMPKGVKRMFCPDCGTRNNDSARFCMKCGTQLITVVPPRVAKVGSSQVKRFSPAIFAIALICFFLPFITVSCGGQKVATLTGVQLVTGTAIEQPDLFGEGQQAETLDGEPLAILAFLSAVAGLGLSFIKGRKIVIAPAISGVAGSILLLLLKSKIDNEILSEGAGMIQVEYGIGFWLTILVFLSAAGLNGFLFLQSEKAVEDDTR